MQLGAFSISLNVKDQGVEIPTEIDPGTEGPANFMIIDPDGNPILIDQHV